MRHITEEGLEFIKGFEGFSAKMYLDLVGIPTIGYGHTKQPLPDSVTEEEAEELLRQDVEAAERAVLRLIKVPLSDGQFDALVSFTYNLGGGALQRSTLRQKVNRGEHEDAAGEFLKWTRAGGRTIKGLVRRRQAESIMYGG